MSRGRPVRVVGRLGVEILAAGRAPVARARAPVAALCLSTLSFPTRAASTAGTPAASAALLSSSHDEAKAAGGSAGAAKTVRAAGAGVAGAVKRAIRPIRRNVDFPPAPGAILSGQWLLLMTLVALGIAAILLGLAVLPRRVVGVPAIVERRAHFAWVGLVLLSAVALAILIGQV